MTFQRRPAALFRVQNYEPKFRLGNFCQTISDSHTQNIFHSQKYRMEFSKIYVLVNFCSIMKRLNF